MVITVDDNDDKDENDDNDDKDENDDNADNADNDDISAQMPVLKNSSRCKSMYCSSPCNITRFAHLRDILRLLLWCSLYVLYIIRPTT